MIVYVKFELSIHGLQFQTQEELNSFVDKLRKSVVAIHPSLRFDDDVEIEIIEHAGEPITGGYDV